MRVEKKTHDPKAQSLNGQKGVVMKWVSGLMTILLLVGFTKAAARPMTFTGVGVAVGESGCQDDMILNPVWFVTNNWIIFEASESGQKNDFNGDGDFRDNVLHVLDMKGGFLRNLGVATAVEFCDNLICSERYLVFPASEHGEGRDLNADGSSNDYVLHAYDLVVDSVTNLEITGRTVGRSWHHADNRVSFVRSESDEPAGDLNGDGDTNEYVNHVFDLRDGKVINLGLADGRGENHHVFSDQIAFLVGEEGQGGKDLNDDGDADDSVIHVYDAVSGTIQNTGLAGWIIGSSDSWANKGGTS